MKKPVSLKLRSKIVQACINKEGTRPELAKRFKVSLGLVKKLLAQHKQTGDLRPRYRFCGRKARLEPEHGKRIRQLVEREPNLTLAQIKERLDLDCTIGAIHWVLKKLGLTYQVRHALRLKKPGPAAKATKARAKPPGQSSS